MNIGITKQSGRLSITTNALSKYMAMIYIVAVKALLPLGIISGGIKLGLLLLLTIITMWSEKMKPQINRLFRVELIFIFVTTLTGIVVAKNIGYVLDTTQTLVYELMFGYCMYKISVTEKSVDWFAYAWIVSSLILVGYLFITGGYSAGKIARLSINESTNVNTLGVFFMFGIWFVLYLLSSNKMTISRVAISVSTIAIFLFFIIQTVSRKALIASIFLIVSWLSFILRPNLKKLNLGKRWAVIILMIVVLGLIYWRFGGAFSNAFVAMDYRMSKLSEENIVDMYRFTLIEDAFKVFTQHPILGVGWNNSRYYSIFGKYSHNTYVEVLTCTGLIGSLPAYSLWFIEIKRILLMIKMKSNRVILANTISLFFVLLFIDSVQIMYYNSTLLMIMHIIFTLCTVGIMKSNEVSYEKESI